MPDVRDKEYIVHYPHGTRKLDLPETTGGYVDNRHIAGLILELLESGEWSIIDCVYAPTQYITIGDPTARDHANAARERAAGVLRATGAMPGDASVDVKMRDETVKARDDAYTRMFNLRNQIAESGAQMFLKRTEQLRAREKGIAFFLGCGLGLATMALCVGSALAYLYLFVW